MAAVAGKGGTGLASDSGEVRMPTPLEAPVRSFDRVLISVWGDLRGGVGASEVLWKEQDERKRALLGRKLREALALRSGTGVKSPQAVRSTRRTCRCGGGRWKTKSMQGNQLV